MAVRRGKLDTVKAVKEEVLKAVQSAHLPAVRCVLDANGTEVRDRAERAVSAAAAGPWPLKVGGGVRVGGN